MEARRSQLRQVCSRQPMARGRFVNARLLFLFYSRSSGLSAPGLFPSVAHARCGAPRLGSFLRGEEAFRRANIVFYVRSRVVRRAKARS